VTGSRRQPQFLRMHGVDTVLFAKLLFTLAMKQEMMGMRSSLGNAGLM